MLKNPPFPIPAQIALVDQLLHAKPNRRTGTEHPIRQAQHRHIPMQHQLEDLIGPEDAPVPLPVVRAHLDQHEEDAEPEEGEEAVEGRGGARRVLPVEVGEATGEDEVAEAGGPLLALVAVHLALHAAAQDVADLRVVGAEQVLASGGGLLELDGDAFPSAAAGLGYVVGGGWDVGGVVDGAVGGADFGAGTVGWVEGGFSLWSTICAALDDVVGIDRQDIVVILILVTGAF